MDRAIAFSLVIIFVALESAIATFAIMRSRAYRPARYLAAICCTLIVLNLATAIRIFANSLSVGTVFGSISSVSLGVLNILLLLMFSALFVPQWWRGKRPIRWIVLPNIVFVAALALDLLGQFGWFVQGFEQVGGIYRSVRVEPGGTIILVAFIISWLVHISILAVAFTRQPRSRGSIGLLIGSIVVASLLAQLLIASTTAQTAQFSSVVQTAPFLLTLAYITLRGSLFETTKVALEFALQHMSEGIVVLNRELRIAYVNPVAQQLGFKLQQLIDQPMLSLGSATEDREKLLTYLQSPHPESLQLTLAVGAPIHLYEVSVSSVYDQDDRVQGHVLLFRDVTEVERRTALLDRERHRLSEIIEQLRNEQAQRSQLMETVQQLTFPVIPVLRGVLVVPVVGTIDASRADEFQTVLTNSIVREKARHVLIDLTGVQLMDAAGVQGLMASIQAAELLGARCTLIGVRPDIAQSLVTFDVGVGALATAATLQDGIASVLTQRNEQTRH